MNIVPHKDFSTSLDDSPIAASAGLGEAILLRTIMKNHPAIRQAVFNVLREQIATLDLAIDEECWQHLVIASSTELEPSLMHVIE